jgi:two-component sensor histidine kinase
VKKYLDRLGRPDAISWVTGLVTLVLMVPAALISSGVDFTGQEVLFSAIVLVRVGAMLVIYAIGKAALVRWSTRRPQPLITLATFWVAMLVGTALFDLLLVVSGLTEEFMLATRLRTTFLGTTATLVLSSLLVTYARDFSRSNVELLEKIDHLQGAKEKAGEDILSRRSQLIGTITESINVELAKFGGTNPDTDSAVMQRLIDDVVRPLSYSLNRDFPVDDEAPPVEPDTAIHWNRVSKEALTGNPFRWLAFTVGIGLISASFLILNFGAAGIFATLALLALSTSMFWLAGRVWRFLPERIGPLARAVLFTAAHVPYGVAVSLAVTDLAGFNLLEPVRLWSFVIIAALISWTVTLVSASLRLLRETNLELAHIVDEVKRELIIVNNSQRQLHKGISRLLHGPIQEAITSSMLRLKAQSESASTIDYADTIRERISEALEQLNTPAVPATDLVTVFSGLTELWSGVVDIQSSISDRDLAIVSADHTAAYALAELVREACSNAIRHGNSRRIDVAVSVFPRKREVLLVVENDGIAPPAHSHPGIGSQLFDEQTLSWSRKKVGSRVRVQARVPLTGEHALATPL